MDLWQKSIKNSLFPVLIISLLFSVVPIYGTVINLRYSSVNGWLEDLFGGSKPTEDTMYESNFAIFAEFDTISGESTEINHKNWVDIQSFNFSMGVPRVEAGISRRRGDVIINDIILTKWVDKSTPKLMEVISKGTVIPEVVIELTRQYDEGKTFYRYELTNVLVTSYQSSASSGKTDPIEPFDKCC